MERRQYSCNIVAHIMLIQCMLCCVVKVCYHEHDYRNKKTLLNDKIYQLVVERLTPL